MVDMDKKEQILHYHRIDGLSQREIARRVAEELFFNHHRHDLSGLDFSLCVKEQAPKDDYGKEFQQKIRGASVRTFS